MGGRIGKGERARARIQTYTSEPTKLNVPKRMLIDQHYPDLTTLEPL